MLQNLCYTNSKKKNYTKPSASTESFKPEPSLSESEYENIINIISNMANVIERSPKAFKDMQEEDLRQHSFTIEWTI